MVTAGLSVIAALLGYVGLTYYLDERPEYAGAEPFDRVHRRKRRGLLGPGTWLQQFGHLPDCQLGLPQRIAAMIRAQFEIQCADFGQRVQVRFPKRWNSAGDVANAGERRFAAGGNDRLCCRLVEAFYVIEPEPDTLLAIVFFDRASPMRACYVHRLEMQPVALGIFDQRERSIKAHRLIVQHRCGECG
jgi:hypothetical protein